MKKLLVYAHYYYPDVASTGQILTDLCEKLVDKYIRQMKFNKDALERKKRSFLKPFILTFEDIVAVEDIITTDMFYYNKPMYKREEIINSLTVKEANDYLKDVDYSNKNVFVIK